VKLELIGLNHTIFSAEIRGRAAINPDHLSDVVNRILENENVEGVVVLSTCNRVELYLSPKLHSSEAELRSLFADVCHLTREESFEPYIMRDAEVTQHLLRVASGLDSQFLGEVQILTQVKQAYHTALQLACTNSILNRLFLQAIECGKLVRTRTGISQGAVSVAYAAVDLAERVFGKLTDRKVLLVGAGETIQLASKYIAESGATSWRVSNRTPERAQLLADALGGEVAAWPVREEDLAWADLIVSATNSPDVVISAESVKHALAHRREPVLFLDLAVPRDVDPALQSADDIYVYCVDDFREMVEANLKLREREAVRAAKLVDREVEEFVTWYRENRIAPTIQQLQLVLEAIRTTEVENNAHRFTPEDREQMEKFSRAMMKKVTSLIVANLKRASLDKNDLSVARAVTMAFAREDQTSVKEVLEKLDHELSH
jgi:glutamyl-tRNA reductase